MQSPLLRFYLGSLTLWLAVLPVRASLEDRWKIEGPRTTDLSSSSNNNNDCATCSSPLVFPLEYTINRHVKYARYRIFQKDCTEEFEEGKEPVKGSGDAIKDKEGGNGPFYSMTLKPDRENPDDQIAVVEFMPIDVSSSWWESLFWWNQKQQSQPDVIEFCIRMGLWLPPEAGEVEVNFRETNVKVTFQDKTALTTTEDGKSSTNIRRIDSITLDPRPLISVNVTVFGGSVSSQNKPVCKGEECESDKQEEESEEVVSQEETKSREEESITNEEL
mmetsp:Transcript_31459/g.52515  ORF Transcript_31459/g.52515 Transcript_31459/m.52515 type:complete len:275 (-) Transcript_31459:250-1074(-)